MSEDRSEKTQEFNAQLITLIVHELRNPLTAIQGYSDLLLQETAGVLNPKQNAFVRLIHQNSEKMGDLITVLSDASRLESGRFIFSPAPLPVSGYLEQAVELLQPLAEEQKSSIVLDLQENLPRVIADPTQLGRILEHLLRNALQYGPQSQRIVLGAELQGKEIRISISDEGYGFEDNKKTLVFDPFFKGHDPRASDVAGWGMGLFLCRNLVRGMQGEMGFDSEQDQGSTFWFKLPAVGDI